MASTVFISGAARGIGRSTALELARRGWTVGVYDIVDDFGWIETEDLGSGKIYSGHLDVTDPQSWEEALKDFAGHTGGEIKVVVNNAGVLYAGPFMEEGSYERDEFLVNVNVKGVLNGSRAAYPYLKAAHDAKLVNLASASAIYGTPDMAVYSATKFAVRGITEALNLEWEQDGITVSSLWPLYVNTGMLDGVSTSGTKKMGVRLGPDDIAQAVADMVQSERGKIAKVHQPVGLQTKVMYAFSHFSPAWLTRFINAKLTTDRPVRP
ncbi:SDR family oxidoreductase [Corynebacterium sp. sy017]|uniref:SDR family oxidoreductase n=1 Tax=unclassified Corynebacterium TaxID=2624378 RepID=UPI00118482DB|nr:MULTISPECIES: SDR family oxidoreductase [unclassified Corynebacterium]MBP3088831.1 SDR family oxidoreductase [Corynebacterium sp. sy017]QDZ42223.1 SDR family oxidoreductase [Corynebacterium sp. sy039]TSD91174.1 SDR family oxidoreductase [Corynebacterium sp. SY003]